MLEAGINTIRVYEPVDDSAILDQLNAAGIQLIVGFGYNQNGVYDIASGTVLDYVKKYKDHPAILFWELGMNTTTTPSGLGETSQLGTRRSTALQQPSKRSIKTTQLQLPTVKFLRKKF